MPFRFIFPLLALFAVMASSASATDYFVRKTGNNANAGTSAATAWLTVDYGADQLVAGDTLYIGAGTYTEQVQPAATCSGTAVNPIRLIADTDGSQTGDAGTVEIVAASWIALYLDATVHDYLEFYGFKITGGTGNAIQSKDSTGILFDNCEVSGAGGDGLRFDAHAVTIRNCSFHDNASSGIYVYNGTTAVIEDTVIYANNSLAGLFVHTLSTATVTRCRIENNLTHGVQVLSGSTTNFKNCLISGNTLYGVIVSSTATNVLNMQNCTVAGNGSYGLSLGGGTNTVTNSIFANNTNDGFSDSSSSTRSYNLIFGNGSGNTAGNSTEIVADPEFVSATDYHITMLSPAKNAGADLSGTVDDDLDGRSRPVDAGYDIGCYEEGPIGHWKLDETAGTTAADSSGLGNDGTVNGTATWTSAIYGNGFDANYTDGDDYVEIPNSSTLENVQEDSYTVAAWFKPESTPPGTGSANDANYAILIKQGSHTGIYYSGSNEFGMAHTLTGYVWAGTGTWTTVTVYPPGQYYHVAGVVDRSAGTTKIYVDGELIDTKSFTPGTASVEHGTVPWTIGIAMPGASSNWKWPADGVIDDARIYNRALSDTEIKELYGLVGHWKLDETSGTTAADSSGLGNDGTYENNPTLGQEGVYGKSLRFDSVSSRVVVPSSPSLDSIGVDDADFSVGLWVKPILAPSGQWRTLYNKGGGTNTPRVPGLWLHPTTNHVYGWFSYSGGDQSLVSSRELPLNQWSHLVLLKKGNNISLFIDGKLDTTSVLAGATVGDPGPIYIGADLTYTTTDSVIDDVRIYNRTLTERHITELYGLMGHWKLDETTGVVAADSSGLGYDGAYTNGPVLGGCGPYTTSAEFDGNNDHVDLPDLNIDYSQGFSMSVWFKPTAIPSAFFGLLGSANGTSADDIWFGWDELAGASGMMIWFSDTVDAGSTRYIFDGMTPELNKWHHCVATVDASGNGKIYRDGVEAASGYMSLPANINRNINRIGSTVYNDEFPGELDDVRLYNRALTATQVASLYGLMGHWKLDETSGTVATDDSPFGNDGTYVNGPVLNVSGKVGTAVNFDGVNDRVEVSSVDIPSSTMSISAWIKIDSFLASATRIVAKANGAGLSDNWWSLTTYDAGGGNNRLGMLFKTTTLGTQFLNASSGNLPTGVWIHVAAVYDGSSMKLYSNGVLVDSLATSGDVAVDSSVPMWIGGSPPNEKYFNGLIDDVRIYSRPLCPEEVQDLASGGVNGIRIIKWVESPN